MADIVPKSKYKGDKARLYETMQKVESLGGEVDSRVPPAPAPQGHYTLQAITNSEGESSYLWMAGYVIPEGKVLMDATFANGIRIIHNDEFVYAMVDADDRFLFGIRVDGTPVFAKTPVVP